MAETVNPLRAAHEAVQARKEACGVADMGSTANVAGPGDAPGMFSGTDLTEEQATEAGQIVTANISLLALRGITDAQMLMAAYTEGLLTGIEHGRKLGGS